MASSLHTEFGHKKETNAICRSSAPFEDVLPPSVMLLTLLAANLFGVGQNLVSFPDPSSF